MKPTTLAPADAPSQTTGEAESSSSTSGRKRRPGPGRPSKLTQELIDDIALRIRAGNWFGTACDLVGISKRAAYEWLEIARDPELLAAKKPAERELISAFLHAVSRANAAAEAKSVKAVRDAEATDWRAGAWYLERRFPERWAPVEKHIKPAREMSDDELDAEITRLQGGEAS